MIFNDSPAVQWRRQLSLSNPPDRLHLTTSIRLQPPGCVLHSKEPSWLRKNQKPLSFRAPAASAGRARTWLESTRSARAVGSSCRVAAAEIHSGVQPAAVVQAARRVPLRHPIASRLRKVLAEFPVANRVKRAWPNGTPTQGNRLGRLR